MTLAEKLQVYHTLKPLTRGADLAVYTKAGVRGHGALNPALELLLQAEVWGDLLDVSGTAGQFAAAKQGSAASSVVLETSRAALRAAAKTFKSSKVEIAAGAVWDTSATRFDTVALLPATDRGSARVDAELRGAHMQLKEGGSLYAVMHKDQGAKRYEKLAKTLFDELELTAKQGGWRRLRAVKKQQGELEVSARQFQAADLTLQAAPGVYAAGKLDPGTAFLLDTLDLQTVLAKRVLDMGCGYGLLSLKAALAGAEVTALDDDLLAVRATYQNAKRYGLDIRCLHSDVDSELGNESFDIVLMNPPFHVGKQVKLDLPTAFIAAAHAHLKAGGELVLVANKALPYEGLLAAFSYWETVATDKAFKVLRAIR